MRWKLAAHYDFDIDQPCKELPGKVRDIHFYDTGSEKFKIVIPKGASQGTLDRATS
ncbi:MAG: hypothetical protein M2R45_04031 [Verrucomicrobia subdivision 3 bacterium]|nr:hypothetical protein [Limisphaerales bacterium]MCS1416985.1 hypothetical protein [Limisphaerales bacterium]